MLSFHLPDSFINQYRTKPEPFGFNGLGAITFYRTYSRQREDGTYESWVDVCQRVIDGMYSIQKDHCIKYERPWSDTKALESAIEAFDRLFNLKWSPSGRGLWMMGVPFIHERHTSEALLNCATITTKNLSQVGGEIFRWFMEMMMLGVGVGSDVSGAFSVKITKPNPYQQEIYVIPDTRDGWANSVKFLVNSYLKPGKSCMNFDYGDIREYGSLIKGFGGVASGPEPLIQLHDNIRSVLNKNDGTYITGRTIADIFNLIGVCVVAGNARRSAEILFGTPDDKEFRNLKNYTLNPEREAWGWMSNNSIVVEDFDKVDYNDYADRIRINGEPGFLWLKNAQKYGRMGEEKIDNGILTNPCGEQILADKEMCMLVETYMNNHDDLYDYLRTLKFAYLYAKTVTLTYDWISDKESREIMCTNRRVGVSQTGIVQFIAKHGLSKLVKFCDEGYNILQHYDIRYSSWFDIPKSIRLTTIKPGGTVPLLAGATPGVHYPEDNFYIRRIRLAANSQLAGILQVAKINIEEDAYNKNTVVASFPIKIENVPTVKDIGMWEQLSLASLLQKYWSDNSVSVTITFDPHNTTNEEIVRALNIYQYQLKDVSMLPRVDGGAYKQMPYESISEEQYNIMSSVIDYRVFNNLGLYMEDSSKLMDLFCDGVACSLTDANIINGLSKEKRNESGENQSQ